MTVVRRFTSSSEAAWDWQLRAVCRGMDTELFFPLDNQRGPQRRERDRAAQQICLACPVRAACLTWAVHVREPDGVWGGFTLREREKVQRRRSD